MSSTSSSIHEVVFIPESVTPTQSYSKSYHSSDTFQEHTPLSKKPRNYKYWSDYEVRKILHWLTLPENEGKLVRNKAQACREIATDLFNGDEQLAISVRSKLMSLEKNYKETKLLQSQLTNNPEEDGSIIEKIKEIGKYHNECKLLFDRTEDAIPTPTSPITSVHSIPNTSFTPVTSSISYHSTTIAKPSTLLHTDHDHYDHHTLPHLHEERLRPLFHPRASWSLPRVSEVDPSHEHIDSRRMFNFSSHSRNPSRHLSEHASIKVARYAARQACSAAKQAAYEANRMESAIRLAEIEKERDKLSIRKLELELELVREKEHQSEER